MQVEDPQLTTRGRVGDRDTLAVRDATAVAAVAIRLVIVEDDLGLLDSLTRIRRQAHAQPIGRPLSDR
jgi:hypothetical protein